MEENEFYFAVVDSTFLPLSRAAIPLGSGVETRLTGETMDRMI